jgi:hypothetical protein
MEKEKTMEIDERGRNPPKQNAGPSLEKQQQSV